MPVMNGIGFGDHTLRKLEDFGTYLGIHMAICKRILHKHHWYDWRYHYFDINAGCGIYEGLTGSPIIALAKARAGGLQMQAYFVEIDAENCRRLEAHVESHLSSNVAVQVINDDHAAFLHSFIHEPRADPKLGVLYHDPSGDVPSFDALVDASSNPAFRHIDFLIYLSATNIKRVRGKFGRDHTQLLTDYLHAIEKPYNNWIIRKPSGRHQWTFLMGSTWDGLPEYKSRGFYRVNSPEGQAILYDLTYSKKELPDDDLPLFCPT